MTEKARRVFWVRLDCDWYSNPKFLRLKRDKKFRAAWIYFAALGWSGRHKKQGYIPDYAFEEIGATKRDIADLIAVGLWYEGEDDGYEINDWGDYQEATAAALERADRAAKAACRRWHKGERAGSCRFCGNSETS